MRATSGGARAVTLKEVFADYLSARKSLKPTTIFDYQRIMKDSFSDWQGKPMLSINIDMVVKRHSKLGERSEARANLSMRFLRALLIFPQVNMKMQGDVHLF